MHRALLGRINGPRGCIPWEFQDKRTKFYYGSPEIAPVGQDLVWKKTVDNENQFQRLYMDRPKTSESEMASRETDIYIACSDDDLNVASLVHSFLRQMGYITYSKIGATLSKIDGNGRDKDVRPLQIKLLQQAQFHSEDSVAISSEAIKHCTAVMVLCTSSISAHCPDIVAAIAHAKDSNKPLLVAAMSKEALGHFPTDKTFSSQSSNARIAIVDLSMMSTQMTNATRESCSSRLSAALEMQLKLSPGGLYKATLAGFGSQRRGRLIPIPRAASTEPPPLSRASTPGQGDALVRVLRREPSAKQMLHYFRSMEPQERDAFLAALAGPDDEQEPGEPESGGGKARAEDKGGAGQGERVKDVWRSEYSEESAALRNSDGQRWGDDGLRTEVKTSGSDASTIRSSPTGSLEPAWSPPRTSAPILGFGGTPSNRTSLSAAARLPFRLADGGQRLTFGSVVGLVQGRPGLAR